MFEKPPDPKAIVSASCIPLGEVVVLAVTITSLLVQLALSKY